MTFIAGDIISFAGDLYEVLEDYGTKGRVKEHSINGNGDIIDPFYWAFENELCVRVGNIDTL